MLFLEIIKHTIGIKQFKCLHKSYAEQSGDCF
jgi:hypothetical protein